MAGELTAISSDPASAQTLSAIYVMKLDGGEVRKASHCDDRWLGSPAWAHDGKRLLYDAAPANRNYREGRIMLERLAPADKQDGEAKDGKKPGQVDPNRADLKPVDLGFGLAPAWSADDKQVAFHLGQGSAAGERPGVYVMNVDGQGREWICEGLRPRWSPNGEKLLVASQHEGFASLYIYDIFEAKLSRVLEQGYDQVIGGCWSPDGKRLAFVGYKGGSAFSGGRGELSLVEAAAGAKPQPLVEDRVGWHPDWSPDGKRLLGWIASGGQERLHLFDVDGLEPPALLAGQSGQHNSDAVFSPDGKQIAWGSVRE
jgi:Tol biopolymer transport system component